MKRKRMKNAVEASPHDSALPGYAISEIHSLHRQIMDNMLERCKKLLLNGKRESLDPG